MTFFCCLINFWAVLGLSKPEEQHRGSQCFCRELRFNLCPPYCPQLAMTFCCCPALAPGQRPGVRSYKAKRLLELGEAKLQGAFRRYHVTQRCRHVAQLSPCCADMCRKCVFHLFLSHLPPKNTFFWPLCHPKTPKPGPYAYAWCYTAVPRNPKVQTRCPIITMFQPEPFSIVHIKVRHENYK